MCQFARRMKRPYPFPAEEADACLAAAAPLPYLPTNTRTLARRMALLRAAVPEWPRELVWTVGALMYASEFEAWYVEAAGTSLRVRLNPADAVLNAAYAVADALGRPLAALRRIWDANSCGPVTIFDSVYDEAHNAKPLEHLACGAFLGVELA